MPSGAPVPSLYGPRATVQDPPDGAAGPDGHVHVRVDVNGMQPHHRAEIVSSEGESCPF